MAGPQVKAPGETKFSIVPEGLAKKAAVSFVEKLDAQSVNGTANEDHVAGVFKLAEQTLSEAEKLAEKIKEKARQEAAEEKAKICAEAEEQGRKQAHRLMETTAQETAAQSSAIIAKAEQEAQQLQRKAQREVHSTLEAARQAADDLLSQTRLEAELTVRKLTGSLTEEIRASVTSMCNRLLPAVDDMADRSD